MTPRSRIDLHTHSAVSDGTDTPAELVRAAGAAGLEVVALTDHDTTAGWPEAVRAAEAEEVRLVRGIEVSTKDEGASVHLLAYLPDPTYPPLEEMLAQIRDGRDTRAPAVVARLRALGSAITLDDVRTAARGAPSTGRPHIADALVALGEVADRGEAFQRYLGHGGPAYVERYAPPLRTAIRVVVAAGGAAVIAHPWSRESRVVLTRERLGELAEVGLAGLEVAHQAHESEESAELARIAEDLGLVQTGSSDYHGLGKVDHDLGCHTTDPDHFLELVEIAGRAATSAGRDAPTVV